MSTKAKSGNPYFYGPVIDFMLVGGFALIVYLSTVLLTGLYEQFKLWELMWFLAFFVNFPHFMLSYQVFYRYHGDRVLTDWRFFIAGVLVPVTLFGLCMAALGSSDSFYARILVYAMFFTVGWHYVKQSFGCFVITSANVGTYYRSTEILIFKGAIYCLWITSFIGLFSGAEFDFWGVKYSYYGLPYWVSQIFYYLTIGGFAASAGVIVLRLFRREKVPNHVAIMAFLTSYLWMLPMLSNSRYAYIIPFFHSLQYLFFVSVYLHNRAESNSGKDSLVYWRQQAVWWLLAIFLGGFFFEWFPNLLDGSFSYDTSEFGTRLFFVLFTLFINIHHYFIDSVIWRGDNPEVRKRLKPVNICRES